MIGSTAAIKLILVGTATSLLGYEALRPAPSQFNSDNEFADDTAGGSDFGPTSQPSHSSSYYGSNYHSHYGWLHSFSGTSGRRWSSSSSRSGSLSSSPSG